MKIRDLKTGDKFNYHGSKRTLIKGHLVVRTGLVHRYAEDEFGYKSWFHPNTEVELIEREEPPEMLEAIAKKYESNHVHHCKDVPVDVEPEVTWHSRGVVENDVEPVAHLIGRAEERLRQRIARTQQWPFCPQCGKNRGLRMELDRKSVDNRYTYTINAFWTCEENGK